MSGHPLAGIAPATDAGYRPSIHRTVVVRDEMLKDDPPYEMAHLKNRDREMILLLLDKIAATGDTRFTPALKAWKKVEYKKVQQRIRQVIRQLEVSNDQ